MLILFHGQSPFQWMGNSTDTTLSLECQASARPLCPTVICTPVMFSPQMGGRGANLGLFRMQVRRSHSVPGRLGRIEELF
jgi:hypothetical protein